MQKNNARSYTGSSLNSCVGTKSETHDAASEL